MPSTPRTALIHDWLTGMRGGEKVLESLCELYPDAPIYTLLADPASVSDVIRAHDIRCSFLQRFPGVEKHYRNLLPLYPSAIERLDLSGYDLVISSSHAVAKGVKPAPGALHISYVHTPMRYVWDMFDQYFNPATVSGFKLWLIRRIASRIRRWDVRSSVRVHHFIANSAYVADRIKRHYGREAVVIYPPVDTKRFRVSRVHDGSYLIVSALVPYKRVDIAIEAATMLGVPLRIIGDGPEAQKLRAMAGPNIRFDGWVSDAVIAEAYSNCRALLFPGEEDFGIVPVEAMASGKPVIAYGRGGATETVKEGLSGTLFQDQTAEALAAALRRFEGMEFDPDAIRRHAERFDRSVFASAMKEFIQRVWAERNA